MGPLGIRTLFERWREWVIGSVDDLTGTGSRGNSYEGKSDIFMLAQADRGDGFGFGVPENAKVLVQEIKEALIEIDPGNAGKYEANAKNLIVKLDQLVAEISATLESSKGKGYIVFHDAYQYFEQRFGMTAVGSITVSLEVVPGASRIRELKD